MRAPQSSKPSSAFEPPARSNRAPPLLLSIEEACESLSISWQTWHREVEPEIKLVRLGRLKRVPVVELEKWIAEHAEAVLR
jgi:hypothetical protein